MATATALFGIPCTILEGAGIEPWDVPMDTPPVEENYVEEQTPEVNYGDENSGGNDGWLVESVYEETVNPLADEGEAAQAAEDAPPTASLTDFQALSVKQLRELAKVMGVSAAGNKAALVERVTTSLLPLGMTELPMPFTHLSPWFAQ